MAVKPTTKDKLECLGEFYENKLATTRTTYQNLLNNSEKENEVLRKQLKELRKGSLIEILVFGIGTIIITNIITILVINIINSK